MQDKDLYQRILGVLPPWSVSDITLNLPDREVVIKVEHKTGIGLPCPHCQQASGIHDHRLRRWRHLDTCQLKTIIESSVPRVNCPEHGVVMVHVDWAENSSRFTALFEAMVIHWLGAAPTSEVARLVGLTWSEVDGIQQRAVNRGLDRRQPAVLKHVGIDETAFQKRHEYVTVVTDREQRVVLEVLNDRKKESVATWLASLDPAHKNTIETVSMDMWDGFSGPFRDYLPEAEKKICFDRFHVASYFAKTVDQVRISEKRSMTDVGEHDDLLNNTKHEWLKNSEQTDNRTRAWFMELTRRTLKTARAWSIKEQAGKLWTFSSRVWAEKAWGRLTGWIDRCRLKPMKKVGAMVKRHLWGIINAIVLSTTNAIGESLNAKIRKVKARACGYRNRTRFRRAILFHLGGLDMLPAAAIKQAHPKP